MDLRLDKKIAEKYHSESQIIRIITEKWVEKELFCPSCGSDLKKYETNKSVLDYYCPGCSEDFELKSKKGLFARKIVDGAYNTMISRLESDNNPHFMLLNYKNYNVEDFFIIPGHYFISDIIEKRKPLNAAARRAGWTGCNILLHKIPYSGRIFYVKNGKVRPRKKVIDAFEKTAFLKKTKQENKGWLLDIMRCIDMQGKNEFVLEEMYRFENKLSAQHPDNRNIKPKIRQQLQFLRDKGYLYFKGKGRYVLNEK